jgi:putative ABC transport system ATP-binding protein
VLPIPSGKEMPLSETESVVSICSLNKSYEGQGFKVDVLKNVFLEVLKGEFVVLSGYSGSGKTTLLNIIGGIDKPTSGEVIVFNENLGEQSEDFLAGFRCNRIGFVFQSYNLVSTLTVAENIAFPMEWTGKEAKKIKEHVEELLSLVDLQRMADHFPFQLSGGEQQRVAFARSLANDPPLLLVDEPTGNLDINTSAGLIRILATLKEQGKTIIVATHDERIFTLAHQKLILKDGQLMSIDE